MLQVIRGVTLVAAAMTVAVTAPAGLTAARQVNAWGTPPEVSWAARAAVPGGVAVSEHLDTAWEAKLQATSKELVAEQQRRQARAAAVPVTARPNRAPADLPPPAATFAAGSVRQTISSAFAPYGDAAVQWGLRVAACESGYDPHAYSASGYYGLYQFSMSTFLINAQRAGFAYSSNDIWDPAANARVAAYMYSNGQQGQWGCR